MRRHQRGRGGESMLMLLWDPAHVPWPSQPVMLQSQEARRAREQRAATCALCAGGGACASAASRPTRPRSLSASGSDQANVVRRCAAHHLPQCTSACGWTHAIGLEVAIRGGEREDRQHHHQHQRQPGCGGHDCKYAVSHHKFFKLFLLFRPTNIVHAP